MSRYRVVLNRAGDGGFEAECPEFPGCRAAGGSRDSVLEKIREAILFYVESCPCDRTAGGSLDLDIHEGRDNLL
ncbi:MAG: type II toxin-antitoxin system HicB family antitoxin [Armatimonadetes bacterium]|nr:type II toxin-antitoxin system HicB family antitoxin [Armatimonadota bacterium]